MTDIKKLISQMTLEEKASLCSGKDAWRTKPIERLGVPSVMVSDGPHGLRKQAREGAGQNESIEAVCFPCACASAASFDRTLTERLGAALGAEARAEGVAVVLGPAVNHKRSPLCGRNFEYYSEDPFLTGEMAAGFIRGVQKNDVGTALKHFAANNQEFRRLTVSSEVDDAALREIYLANFEGAVKGGKPWTVMGSYNRINGQYAGEAPWLLTGILRGSWGFDGMVMSDWGAVNDRVAGLRAGLELQMPSCGGRTDAQIVEAVQSGKLDAAVLDRAAERVLKMVYKYTDSHKTAFFDKEADHRTAAELAGECAVLLKNTGVLPLDKGKKVVFIGEYANAPRIQGGGSSHINTKNIPGALQAAGEIPGVTFAQGWRLSDKGPDPDLIAEAAEAARGADAAVIFAGLPDACECEGYDRAGLDLPENQNALISAVAEAQPNTAVVLHNGSPVAMPWLDGVGAVLEMYLAGEGSGEAAAALLFGDVNPSGKLPETFPMRLQDTPAYLDFGGDGHTVRYGEGVFTGYRWYDARELPVLFPFGHGLSYTTFEYRGLTLSSEAPAEGEKLTVTLKVKNVGTRWGREAVQLYVRDRATSFRRPEKELKGFAKAALAPGEEKELRFELGDRAFAHWEAGEKRWKISAGEYDVMAAASSRDIRLTASLRHGGSAPLCFAVDENTTLGELLDDPRTHGAVSLLLKVFLPRGKRSDVSDAAITPEMVRAAALSAPLRMVRDMIPAKAYDAAVAQLNRMLAKPAQK